LRKSLRKAAGRLEPEQMVVLRNANPVLCDDSAHLERAGKGELPHWTHNELLDFHFWANRHLRAKNAVFALFSGDSGIFSEFPSFKHMEKAVAVDALTVETEK